MIIDKIENLNQYKQINPLFVKVIEYISKTNLSEQELGKTKIQGDELIVNFAQTNLKKKADAKLETHNRYIDIQIPLTGIEMMGYTPRTDLPEEEYNSEKDITFYHGLAENYFEVKPGMFAIFFPEDAHAPAITDKSIKKVIFKVLV